jgi:hypothetical protein
MPDPTKRIEAWNVKTTPERTKQTLDARHAEMKRRYEVAMTALCSIEGQIKQTLNAQGVHTSLYVPYLNFGRQLWKMTRQQEICCERFECQGAGRHPDRGLRHTGTEILRPAGGGKHKTPNPKPQTGFRGGDERTKAEGPRTKQV